MLTSITPLGERGRGNKFWLTRTWLVVGHVLGGLALGAVMAVVSLTFAAVLGRPPDTTVVAAIAIAAFLAVVGDIVGLTVPGRRQVDERWLTTYRGWVYGVGFGAQLGFGLVTVVNTLLFGAFLLSGALLPPLSALAVGGVYGLTRGVGATLNGRVRTVNDLRRLHQWIDERERTIRLSSLGAVAIVALGAVVVA